MQEQVPEVSTKQLSKKVSSDRFSRRRNDSSCGIADPRQFATLLTRTCCITLTPEVKLIIAMLERAWADASQSASARNFFLKGDAGLWGQLIGIDPTFLLETYQKHHRAARAQ